MAFVKKAYRAATFAVDYPRKLTVQLTADGQVRVLAEGVVQSVSVVQVDDFLRIAAAIKALEVS